MPLDKITLKTAIIAAQNAAAGAPDIATAQNLYATALSNAIDIYVRGGTVTTVVATTGSPTAQTGTGTGAIT